MLNILCFDKLPSTNDEALEILSNAPSELCIMAVTQTGGRGRLNGRVWVSHHKNFHASFIINLKKVGISESNSQMITHVALRSLHSVIQKNFNIKTEIKFPNDILVNDKKLSGVLSEVSYPYAVVGIGINTHSSPIDSSTDLSKFTQIKIENEDLAIIVFENILMEINNVKLCG